jgi:hypothetical protein
MKTKLNTRQLAAVSVFISALATGILYLLDTYVEFFNTARHDGQYYAFMFVWMCVCYFFIMRFVKNRQKKKK